jgi:outer membrane protein OmpA-like peptidoglycan-associated protein
MTFSLKALLLLGAALLGGAQDAREAVRFVACPVYRDTDNGRKSGCWLASDPATDIRYDVTAAPTKPDWNHAILVEGFVAKDAGDPCGGTVIEPARVSVLEAPCTRHLIKAEGYAGRRFALPERNVRPLYEARKRPEKPFVEGRFTIPFDLGSSFITYQLSDYYLDATINYALDVQPARIEIAGSAQTIAETASGETIVENAALAFERAEKVRTALILRGIAPDRVKIVDALPDPFVAAAFDGLNWPEPRRVDVRIVPD